MIKYELVNNRIPDKDIIKIVDNYITDMSAQYSKEELYLKGKNTSILSSKIKDNDLNIPNWRIPVAYGRKIVKTVTGYMYAPGLITYQDAPDKLTEIFKNNEEPIENQSLGTYQGANGKTYELQYIGDDGEYNFAMVKASEGIAIYDYSIKPKMQAFIRFYMKQKAWIYHVYYSDKIFKFERKVDMVENKAIAKDNTIALLEEEENIFNEIPIIEIDNNGNEVSDISIVIDLIDAYDMLVTDGANEISRFAWAYLLLFGMKIEADKLEQIKKQRVMQNLPDEARVEFLTRDIPSEFIETLAARVKKEIHLQSFIPDIDEVTFTSGASGVAISKFIYLMEFIAAEKEAFFKSALYKRLKLMNVIYPEIDPDTIKIEFQRNKPESDAIGAEIYQKLDGRGISRETLITKYTSIEDAEEEMKKYDKEQEKNKTASFEDVEETDDTNEEEEDQENEQNI